MSEEESPILAWLRAISVLSPNATSSRCRPVSFWAARASFFVGRPVTEAEVRRAMAGLRTIKVSATAETNLLAKESLKRACVVYPDRYRWDPATERIIEAA